MFEYFIAKKYLRTKNKLSFISIISMLSTLGVTIGVAALIIVLSVFNGFSSIVSSMLINFDPHVRISSKGLNPQNSAELYEFLNNQKSIKSFAPYAEGKIILMNRGATEIINIKGIPFDDEDYRKRLESRINYGEFDLTPEIGNEKIIISLPIALKLSARPGDTIIATSASQIKKSIARFSIPQTQKFIVSGVYEISNKEYAMDYTFTSLSAVQKLLNLKDNFSGMEIIMKDLDDSEMLKQQILNKDAFKNFTVNTWYDLHKDMYRIMLIEKWATYILLSLIIAVAAFNILSSLTMSVLQKKKDIGVLRSIGASKNSIKKIFMFEGILVGVIGTFAGLIIGLLVCYIQIEFNIYPLDASKFAIDTLPIDVKVMDVIAVSIISLLLTFFASKYPANKALNVKLIDAIKWE